jgi:4-amino-4-deoxy-L-arabinose transferase-like glycosyltransferase
MVADGKSDAEPSPVTAGRRDELTPSLLVAGLIVLALVLRFWRIGEWNFQATEIFTLRDSLHPKLSNPRPLGYLLDHFLVGPFLPLDEFGLRLLPAIFGVLAIPAFYLICRRLAGTRAALCGALVLTLSPLHVMYSQLARYWSLVFLLSAIYPYALYIGLRERNRRWMAIGVVTAVLAVLAHPVSIVLVGGIALYLVGGLRREEVVRFWRKPAVRWVLVFVLVIIAAITLRFVGVLQGWIAMHDENPGYGQFLRPPMPAPGMKQLIYLSIYVESLTVPVVLGATAGICWLWQGRDRSLARFLTCVAGFHIGFLTLLSMRTSVSQYYLLPSAPVFYLGVGIFLDQLFRLETPFRPRWLLPATMAAILVAAGAPTLLSDTRDGRRYHFRSAAHWIAARLGRTDIVFSDQPMVLAHYLPRHPVRHLRQDLGLLKEAMGELREAGHGGVLWIVAPAASHAYRPTMRQGGMIAWIYENCQLRNNIGVGRIDFRQQYLHIYRCPSAMPGGSPAAP